MKNISISPRQFIQAGFSLVEMLVVIAIIGIIAAIAIPNIGNINSSSKEAVTKRQAQDIVSVFGAGRAAGAPSFVAAGNVRQAMDAVGAGDYGTGVFAGSQFKIEGVHQQMGVDAPVAERVGWYLHWNGDGMSYDKAGGNLN